MLWFLANIKKTFWTFYWRAQISGLQLLHKYNSLFWVVELSVPNFSYGKKLENLTMFCYCFVTILKPPAWYCGGGQLKIKTHSDNFTAFHKMSNVSQQDRLHPNHAGSHLLLVNIEITVHYCGLCVSQSDADISGHWQSFNDFDFKHHHSDFEMKSDKMWSKSRLLALI